MITLTVTGSIKLLVFSDCEYSVAEYIGQKIDRARR